MTRSTGTGDTLTCIMESASQETLRGTGQGTGAKKGLQTPSNLPLRFTDWKNEAKGASLSSTT